MVEEFNKESIIADESSVDQTEVDRIRAERKERATSYMHTVLDTARTYKKRIIRDEDIERKIDAVRNAFTEDEFARLQQKISSKDRMTGANNRDRQNQAIRIALAEAMKTDQAIHPEIQREQQLARAGRMGFIAFDLRGLKVVNDLTKDHAKGDAYLQETASIVEQQVLTKIREVITTLAEQQRRSSNTDIDFGRDGGDEFSIFISGDVDLEQSLTDEQIETLFATEHSDAFTTERRQRRAQGFSPDGRRLRLSNKLIDVFTEFTDITLAEASLEDIVTREMAQEHVGPGIEVPEGWKLRPFIAAGGSTVREVLEDPHIAHFKNLERNPKNGSEAVNIILGAVRKDADVKSYQAKKRQTKYWKESNNPVDRFQAQIQARNEDMLVALLERDEFRQRAISAEQEIETLNRELRATKADLQACLENKSAHL